MGGSGLVVVYSSRFDDFNRVVASGLGTSDAGTDWDNTYGTAELSSVDGDSALLGMLAFNSSTHSITDAAGPWTSAFTCTVRFTWPSVYLGASQRLLFDVTDNPASETQYLRWYIDRNGSHVWAEWWDGATGVSDDLVVTIVVGATAYLKATYDPATGVLQAKYWEENATEPDYQVSVTASGLGALPAFLMQASYPGDMVTTTYMDVDYIDFGGGAVVISGR